MDKIKGANYFTKLDVQWGYNNVQIRKGDQWKAAFKTNRGLFKPTVMFFGMCNSPATFQAMMDSIFKDMIEGTLIIVYMDDILIFAKTQEELEWITKTVLQRLRDNDLFLKPKKCKFNKDGVFGIDHSRRTTIDGPCQGKRTIRLADSYNRQTSMIVPWIWKLLSEIHQEVF